MDTAESAPETVMVAGEEASVYLQATVQVVWAPVGQTPVVKVDPNRDNRHFYGSLNLQTGKEIAMRTTVMKAVTSVLFLLKLVLAYPDQKILLLWARAPWHFGPAIRNFLAAYPNLEIFYFPPPCLISIRKSMFGKMPENRLHIIIQSTKLIPWLTYLRRI
jgi:hypothetical protein